MPRGRKVSPEQSVVTLRQIEVQLALGQSLALACKEAGISEQSYYRWRKEYGGVAVEQAKRLKDLERENARLRRLVAGAGRRDGALQEAHGLQRPDRSPDPRLSQLEVVVTGERAAVDREGLRQAARHRPVAGNERRQSEGSLPIAEGRQGGREAIPHDMGQAVAPLPC